MIHRKILIVVLVIMTMTSCSFGPKKMLIEGEAQGTYFSITYYDKQDRDFTQEIDSILRAFDMSVSLWEDQSLISRINRNEDIEVDSIILELLKISDNVTRNSKGAFDVTVGKLVETWGFHRKKGLMPDSAKVKELLSHIGFDKIKIENKHIIKLDSAIHIDFNAIAQGYSTDIIAKFLASQGIESYLVDVGGEIAGKGTKPDGSFWMVGIEKPAENASDGRDIQLIIPLKEKSIATSGSYRKYREQDGHRYSHTIDPSTGYPVTHNLLSVSVIADDAATADAYATAFMVMGIQKATRMLDSYKKLEAYFIYSGSEGSTKTFATPGMERLIAEGKALQKKK